MLHCITIAAFCLDQQCEGKGQGTKLIPEKPNEKAQVLQRTFEGNTLHQKMSMLVLPRSALLSISEHTC